MEHDFIAANPIIYVLIAWVAIFVSAKALRLERYGVKITPYSLVYKNASVQDILVRMLGRMRRAVRVFADLSVVAGFAMMGFAFWFLGHNVAQYFIEPSGFSEVTVLIPGVTLTSTPAIVNFLLCIPIVLVMHEGAHGIVAALERIKIKTGGFAVFIALFAGFVEPDEEEFERAKKISKMRVIGAGATSNVIFAMLLGAVLLTNPLFALVVPEPFLSAFYEEPHGIGVISVMEGFGAESAGLQPGDIIVSIDGTPTTTQAEFQGISPVPGETISVGILRDGGRLDIPVQIMPSPDDPERGLIGIIRDNASYVPIYNIIEWNNPEISLFLLWLWMISFFIGIINMLPLPILDGGKFIHSMISDKVSEGSVRYIMWGIYGITFALFALNIGLSYAKSGWITI